MRYTVVFKSHLNGKYQRVSVPPYGDDNLYYETQDLNAAKRNLKRWNGQSQTYRIVILDEKNNFIELEDIQLSENKVKELNKLVEWLES